MSIEAFGSFWDALVDKRFGADTVLSKEERLIYAANLLRGAVLESGLVGYFLETEANEIRDTHEALRSLDLAEPLRLLQQAQEIALNGAPLPDSDETLTLFDEDLSEDEYEAAIDDLGERLAPIQDQLLLQDDAIFDAINRFAIEKGLIST